MQSFVILLISLSLIEISISLFISFVIAGEIVDIDEGFVGDLEFILLEREV
jgi:hypothetical protein